MQNRRMRKATPVRKKKRRLVRERPKKNTLLLLLFIYTVSTLYMEFKVWRRKKAKAAAGATGPSA